MILEAYAICSFKLPMRAEYLKRFFVSGNFVKVAFDFLFPMLSSKSIPFSFFVAPHNLLIESLKVMSSSFNSASDFSTSKV